jgi:ribose 5-phosphate isomerase A
VAFSHLCILGMLSTDEIKQLAGEAGAELVKEDMVVGLGSGSTVFYLIQALAKKVKNGLNCLAVPTSTQTRLLALQQNIPLTELNEVPAIDLTIDGADEIDASLNLIKGGGGFLLQEKMVAAASRRLVIIADNTKLKPVLGNFPLPVEVIPYGWKHVQRHIHALTRTRSALRMRDNKPYVTENGHFILDCHFQKIEEPFVLSNNLNMIPGVVETGLFLNMCEKALIAYPDGSLKTLIKGNH